MNSAIKISIFVLLLAGFAYILTSRLKPPGFAWDMSVAGVLGIFMIIASIYSGLSKNVKITFSVFGT